MKGWAWVLVAGLFEMGFTTALKLQQSDPRWQLPFILCAVASFECLARGIRTLSIGLAYAVWTGMGTVGAVAVGIIGFGDSAHPLRIAVVAALVTALVALKLVTGGENATPPASAPRPSGR